MIDGPIIEIEGGHVLANVEERTISGRLIPFNEEGRTNVGRFQVSAGDIDISRGVADPSIIGLNLDHDRTEVVGHGRKVWEQVDGIYCSWNIARTPEGDAALADAVSPDGKRRRLSGEFGPAVIRDGKLVPGHARLWGSALVPKGAFPSAMVLAADTPDEDDEDDTQTPDEAPVTPEEGVPEVAENSEAGVAPAEEVPEVVAAQPARHVQAAAQVEPRPVSLDMVVQSIARVKANPTDGEGLQVLAALTDITFTGANSLPLGGSVIQPAWVGQLYDGIPYVREYIGLGKLGTNINAAGKKGYRVNRGTSGSPILSPAGIPNGGTWQGNKVEINSYNGWTETASSTLRKFAVGNDIAREFFDLPGGEDVVRAFLQLIFEDYAYWSDTNALADINVNTQAPIANATYPTPYPVAMGQLIQGILAVKKRKTDGRRDVPTFAIANDLAYAQLVYAAGGDTALPAFVDINVGTDSTGAADSVRVVNGDNGIQATPSVTVGASSSIEFDELPGGPLVVNALDLARGGVDRAVHGYLQTFVNRPEALVRIGTADTGATTTAYGVGRVISFGATIYVVTTAGTTAGTAPTAPAIGATVTSGTAVLTRIA